MPLLFLSLFFGVLAYYYRKKKLFFSVVMFYGIGSLWGFLMTLNDYYSLSLNFGYQSISYTTTLFLSVCCLILFYPLMQIDRKLIFSGMVDVCHLKNIAYIFIVLSIVYCIFIVPYISLSLNAIDFAAYKAEIMEKGGLDISGGNIILSKLFSYQVQLRPFIIFLFFFSLVYVKGGRKMKILLGLMTILPALFSALASAHRNNLVYCIINYIVCYILFYECFPRKVKRYVLLFISIVLGIVLFIVVYFAFLRFDDGGGAVIYSLLRYLGEPFVNFNTMLWGNEQYLLGNKSFPLIRDLLGLDYLDPSTIRENTSYLRYVNYYFYGAIGNFYMDFGPLGTICVCLLVSCFFYKIFVQKFKANTLTRLLLLYLYATYTIQNYFYFQFMGSNNINIFWMIIYLLVFRFYVEKGCSVFSSGRSFKRQV